MTIGQALSNALSGLTVAGRRASVVANNIANAQTEGYVVRSADVAEQTTAGVGAGATIAGISRTAAPALTAERRLADAEFAFDDAISSAIARIARALPQPESSQSLVSRVAAFENGLRTLAETPEDSIIQADASDAARVLAETLNGLSQQVQRERASADAAIAERVGDVNDALRRIESLNGAVARGAASDADVNALIDQRAQAIDVVNRNIPVRVVQRAGGVDLVTPEGAFLLAGEARQLSFSPASLVTADAVYADGAGALSGLSIDGVNLTPGGATAPTGGALAGFFSVRDEQLPAISDALDAFAFDLASRYNAPGLDPTVAPGAPGLFTDNGARADSANVVGLAGRLALNAAADPRAGGSAAALRDGLGAVAPGPAGADQLIRDFLAVLTEPRPAPTGLQTTRNLSVAEGAAQITSIIAATDAAAEDVRLGSDVFLQSLREAEIGATGVDTDAELQKLLAIEQSYAANARVIQTADRLIQRLLEI